MLNPRLKLLNCSKEVIEIVLQGDHVITKKLGLIVPHKWSEFGDDIFKYTLESIKTNPDSCKWWAYLPIIIESNTLIGSCGYKGEPSEGMVEIGYEIAKAYRNKGFATEIVGMLIKKAFESDQVRYIQAHTLAEENASVHILRKKGFTFICELADPEEGLIWKWELYK